MTHFVRLLKDNSGAAAAEYALILAIIGSGIALAAYNLGGSIKNSMSNAGTCIKFEANVKPSC